MKTEGHFIDHCEDENGVPCGLGGFDYKCPECGNFSSNYDIWYKDLEIYKGKKVNFNCEHCRTELIVFWDSENLSYYIIKNEI